MKWQLRDEPFTLPEHLEWKVKEALRVACEISGKDLKQYVTEAIKEKLNRDYGSKLK